ncbi:MAG TPA: ribosome assembly RNA-binding protein YhbY [Polyangiaceae bacterium]
MPLTGAAARTLRALAHSLQPVVHVGKQGVTPKLVAQLERALLDHELIKVKILPEAPGDRKDIGAALADATGAELAQLIGRVALLYKPHPKKPQIPVPKGYTKPKPKPAKDETEEE